MKKKWVLATLLGLCLGACRETKLESSQTSSTGRETSDDAKAADEKVSPPVPITGAWLNASVLEETSNNGKAQSRVGISSYYNGIKISDHRDRFIVTFTAASMAGGVSTSTSNASNGEYDQIVTIQGNNLSQIRAEFRSIMLYLTVFDRSDNSTDTNEFPLDSVLIESKSKTSVSTSTSTTTTTSTSTNGTAGTAGTAGTGGTAGTAGTAGGPGQ